MTTSEKRGQVEIETEEAAVEGAEESDTERVTVGAEEEDEAGNGDDEGGFD